MPKPSSRRTSLQPVFEPYDLLESTPMMMPSMTSSPPTNGFGSNGFESDAMDQPDALNPSEALDQLDTLDESPCIPFHAHHDEQARGDELVHAETNGESNHVASNHAAPDHSAAIDGTVIDGPAINGFVVHAEPAANGAIPPASDDVISRDAAHLNGHAILNGHAGVNGTQFDGIEVETARVNGGHVNGVKIDGAHVNGAHASGAAIATGSISEIVARAPVPPAPPVEEPSQAESPIQADEPIQASVEQAQDDSFSSAPAATTAREPHPAAGSMFVPYLVTEIRELRDRHARRRSWWRRIFG
jgi:hypothetical protein